MVRELVPATHRPSDAKPVPALREIDAEVWKALSNTSARQFIENVNDGLTRIFLMALEALGIEMIA